MTSSRQCPYFTVEVDASLLTTDKQAPRPPFSPPYSLKAQKRRVCPAEATTAALTFSLPSNEYLYGTAAVVMFPFGAVLVLPPKETSSTVAYPVLSLSSVVMAFLDSSNAEDWMRSWAPIRVLIPEPPTLRKNELGHDLSVGSSHTARLNIENLLVHVARAKSKRGCPAVDVIPVVISVGHMQVPLVLASILVRVSHQGCFPLSWGRSVGRALWGGGSLRFELT